MNNHLAFNAEEFPHTFWVYESLGAAYIRTGQKDLAIINLKKTLELNPNNTNAIVMLKKISEMK